MTDDNHVVITGLGFVLPIGFTEDTIWNHLLNGRTAIKNIKSIDTSEFRTKNGAEVDTTTLYKELKAVNIKPFMDKTVDMGMLASFYALNDAKLLSPQRKKSKIACIAGTGYGSSQSIYETYISYAKEGYRGVRPTSVPRCMTSAISANISITFGLCGPNFTVSSACTSSSTAIGIAREMIISGSEDIVLCVGSETMFDPVAFAGWDKLGVMSKIEKPEISCRPFDINRDGCILGEGSAAMIIESYKSAIKRNAKIRAKLIGYGECSDATHLTRPDPEGQAEAIRIALHSAGIDITRIGYINAHGTATHINDICESQSINMVFGSYTPQIPVGAFKSFFGHTLGASGIIEIGCCILALEHGIIPPNLNIETPDPSCNLNLVKSTPAPLKNRTIMKNVFGFGGDNSVVIITA